MKEDGKITWVPASYRGAVTSKLSASNGRGEAGGSMKLGRGGAA